MSDLQKYLRGQIWWQKPNGNTLINGVQSEGRPVVIVSNNAGNRYSPSVIVAPFTTATKKNLPTHTQVLMENGQISTVLCEQLRTINTEMLKEYIGTVDETKMTEIDACLLASLGFKPETKPEPIQLESLSFSETIPIDNTPTTPDPEPTEPTEESEKTEETKSIEHKNRAKRFSKQEKKMIERYVSTHSISDTTVFFAKMYPDIEYKQLYTRIANVKNRMKK